MICAAKHLGSDGECPVVEAENPVTARLCLTYGGDQSPDFLVPGLIRKALSGLPARVLRPQAQRDLIHVRDCVAALRLAADHAAALPPIVTVATGRPLLAGHLADAVAAMQREPVNERWQAEMTPYFVTGETPADHQMRPLDEVFHLEDQLRAAGLATHPQELRA